MEAQGAKEQVCFARYSECIVLKARPTCKVQSERDEAVIASQELQGFLSLHQSPKVICYSFSIEEVVDTNQEVPEANKAGIYSYIFISVFFSLSFCSLRCIIESLLVLDVCCIGHWA